jgi:hypothetical protein
MPYGLAMLLEKAQIALNKISNTGFSWEITFITLSSLPLSPKSPFKT